MAASEIIKSIEESVLMEEASNLRMKFILLIDSSVRLVGLSV